MSDKALEDIDLEHDLVYAMKIIDECSDSVNILMNVDAKNLI
jgi:hypothetical protein